MVAVQAAAVAIVSVIDAMRKRRAPQSGRFPHLPSQNAQVGPNSITISTYSRELYDVMLADTRAAKDRIFLEWFITKADEAGTEFRSALIEAAQRGVNTYVITDTWGNTNQDSRFRRLFRMEHLHTLLSPFIYPGLFNGRARDRGRDHRKILTVDKHIGYVDGYNIDTLYAHKWHDTHARVERPAVWEFSDAFIDMWNDYHKKHHPIIADGGMTDWSATVRAVMNTPALNVFPTSALYMDTINHPVVRVWIAMGCFIPEELVLIAMAGAVHRGVGIRVLIPGYSSHIVGDWAGRPHYECLLRSGVRTFLYEEAMVHSKTMTADGRWSTVDAANIDGLLLRSSFGINIEVFDPGFAAITERIFGVDLANPHGPILEQWRVRGGRDRVLETVLRPLVSLL